MNQDPTNMETIYYTKSVFTKGFQIGNKHPGTTQDDCKGKCKWKSMGVPKWHRCIKCGTQELIAKEVKRNE